MLQARWSRMDVRGHHFRRRPRPIRDRYCRAVEGRWWSRTPACLNLKKVAGEELPLGKPVLILSNFLGFRRTPVLVRGTYQ
jgi:hypothetical protein